MKTKRALLWIVVLALFAGLSACGAGGGGKLTKALAFAPEDTRQVGFTDWALIKAYEGVPDLNGSSDEDERRTFWASLQQDQASASGFGPQFGLLLPDLWGWDSVDLDWEATIEGEGAPVYVLRFRDDFDFAPLLELFEEREFSQDDYHGVTVYSHELDLALDWLRRFLPMANAAFLPGEKALVVSSNRESVEAVLDAYQGRAKALGGDGAIQALVDRVGEVAAVMVWADPCAWAVPGATDGPSLSPEDIARLEAEWGLEGDLQIHAYEALAAGYRYEDDVPVGLVVLHYADAGDAQADLELRQKAIAEGSSWILAPGRPFQEVVFAVEQATVQGSDLVLRVRPAQDQPRRLFHPFFVRDIPFAICP